MKYSIQSALLRGLRVSVAVLFSCAVVYYTARPEYMTLVPVLNMAGKYLREEFNIPYMPV